MSSLIPISLGCVAMEINVGPTSDWYPPEKKPYRTATTTDPAAVCAKDRECKDPRSCTHDDEEVKTPEVVGNEVWKDPTDGRSAIEDGEEVICDVWRQILITSMNL
jgi:hypothetical protein